jgi:hypothetical protein
MIGYSRKEICNQLLTVNLIQAKVELTFGKKAAPVSLFCIGSGQIECPKNLGAIRSCLIPLIPGQFHKEINNN